MLKKEEGRISHIVCAHNNYNANKTQYNLAK